MVQILCRGALTARDHGAPGDTTAARDSGGCSCIQAGKESFRRGTHAKLGVRFVPAADHQTAIN